jgi:hypothetical protein
MLRAGLPVITTLGTEISQIVGEQRLGVTFAPGDADDLREAILTLARDETRRRRCAARAREYVTKHRLVEQVMDPLKQWSRDPAPSPDRVVQAADGARSWQPRTGAGRVVRAFEAGGPLAAVRETGRVAVAALADVLSRAFIKRDSAPSWGLDRREPPLTALVVRAGQLATTQRAVERMLARYPAADISVLAPGPLVEESRFEVEVPVIAATAGEACGYKVGSRLINAVRERRFDTVVVAGEGNRRAELVALLSGADRRVEVRDDGAAHVFRFAWYKPVLALGGLVAGLLEKVMLSALVGLVWASIAAEGRLWRLRLRLAGAAADSRE